MITPKSYGSFNKFYDFARLMKSGKIYRNLHAFGRQGVDALASASPVDTGLMAQSWGYQVELTRDKASISWFNTDREGGVNIAVIVQYGHATGTGGYVAGRDFINPAMRPLFDKIANDVWRQVTNG